MLPFIPHPSPQNKHKHLLFPNSIHHSLLLATTPTYSHEGSKQSAEEIIGTCKQSGADSMAVHCDLTDEKTIQSCVNQVTEKYGHIDILINNAGIVFDKDFDDRTAEDFRKTFEVNVIGTFLMSKYVAPIMVKNGGGNIVIASSTSGTYNFNTTSIDILRRNARRFCSRGLRTWRSRKTLLLSRLRRIKLCECSSYND